MSARTKTENILSYFLNDIAEIFPLLFIFYAAAFLLSLIFDSWQAYFNWTIFHVNILILALLSFLSETGRNKFFSLMAPLKEEVKKIIALRRKQLILRGKKVTVFNLPLMLFEIAATYIIEIIKRGIIGFLKFTVNIFVLALDIRKQSTTNYLKFIILVLVLFYATARGTGIAEILILVYAFRAIFVGIDSRVTSGGALFFLASFVILSILKQPEFAGRLAVFAYYFLIIAVITQLLEFKNNNFKI